MNIFNILFNAIIADFREFDAGSVVSVVGFIKGSAVGELYNQRKKLKFIWNQTHSPSWVIFAKVFMKNVQE